jgi:hypothetical protein
MNRDLLDEIDNVYRVFAPYSCDRLVQSDTDCARDSLIDELSAKLCKKDIRSLDAESLLDYYYLAVSHIGNVNDLRHFLPRIVEIVVTEPNGYLDPRLLAETLRRADAQDMTPSEKSALRDLLKDAEGTLTKRIVEGALNVLKPERLT